MVVEHVKDLNTYYAEGSDHFSAATVNDFTLAEIDEAIIDASELDRPQPVGCGRQLAAQDHLDMGNAAARRMRRQP
jgi:hypothetical protein